MRAKWAEEGMAGAGRVMRVAVQEAETRAEARGRRSVYTLDRPHTQLVRSHRPHRELLRSTRTAHMRYILQAPCCSPQGVEEAEAAMEALPAEVEMAATRR